MLADVPAQLRLLDLQAEDTAIAQLEHRRRTLGEHAAIAEAKTARNRIGAALIAARTEVADLQLEVEKAEADLVPVRERRVRDQQRVDSGTVTDPKQLSALIEEIAHLGRRINDLEDVELAVMERLEAATATHDELVAELAEVDSSLRALIAARDERTAELDADLAQRSAVRAALAAQIPADLLALYDRIRERSGGLGAAALQGRRCSGCQLEATPDALAGYAAAAPEEVLRCEECQRVLVRTSAVSR